MEAAEKRHQGDGTKGAARPGWLKDKKWLSEPTECFGCAETDHCNRHSCARRRNNGHRIPAAMAA